jgi:hypothetical protein
VDLRVVALTCLLGSCDWLVGLHHLPARPIDGAPPSDAVDAVSIDAPLGHDEDGDGVPDTADVCPNIFDPSQTDTDGDGVGDACDPHMNLPIDQIVYFEPFANIDRWMTVGDGAQWTLENDAWRQAASGTTNEVAVFAMGPLVDPTIVVTISDVAGATNPDAGAFIAQSAPMVPLPPGIFCYAEVKRATLEFYEFRNSVGGPSDASMPAGGDPITLELTASSEVGPPACAAKFAGAPTSTVGSASNNAPLGSGYVGLYTYGAAATFRSALVIAHRP